MMPPRHNLSGIIVFFLRYHFRPGPVEHETLSRVNLLCDPVPIQVHALQYAISHTTSWLLLCLLFTMSVDPTSIVSMIEQCVKIYDYIEAVKESSKQRQRFMQEVATLRDVLVNLQGLLRDEAFTQNRSSMAPLKVLFDPTKPFVGLIERDLAELEGKLRGAMKKNRTGWRSSWTKVVAAGMWPLDKAESEVLFVRLERHKSLVSLAMQHDVE